MNKGSIYVLIGGALGAFTRYILKGLDFSLVLLGVKPNILLVNTLGCFLMGAILTFSFLHKKMSNELKIGITTGFLGAFTTFSTICKELYGLISAGHLVNAFLYALLSVFSGFIAVVLGIVFVRRIYPSMKLCEIRDELPEKEVL